MVDATRYGIALYKTDIAVEDIRHSFRNGWRSICLGYSQGGSVALATQRCDGHPDTQLRNSEHYRGWKALYREVGSG